MLINTSCEEKGTNALGVVAVLLLPEARRGVGTKRDRLEAETLLCGGATHCGLLTIVCEIFKAHF